MDKRVSDILAMAIKREEEAYDFYMAFMPGSPIRP